MDIKKYLFSEIRKCRFKINLAKGIDCSVVAAAAGGIGGMFCELASLVWEFYYAHMAAGICFGFGILAGMAYAVCRRADMRQAARRLDSFGLKERMITAYEQMEREEAVGKDFGKKGKPADRASEENELVQMQREDAFSYYMQIREKIKIRLVPDKRHIFALLLSMGMVLGIAMLPSPVREQAQNRHRIQAQAKEEREKLEELLEALEAVNQESLTEEQKATLKELQDAMALSREELTKADSWSSLASAVEKLEYKYGQAGQSLEQIAGLLENPEAAGIAAAEAMAKAAANGNGPQMASGGTAFQAGGDSSGDGDGQGNGDSSGNGDGSGDGSGNGDGSGGGDGSGNGDGSGSGNGSGNGGGQGRGTGSSTSSHDYVSIPNGIGNDSTLTGDRNGSQDSEYFRQQNGLAWEGEHVDYNSVIGQYTENAYEGIANNRYPIGMESVIRDYFGNLNQ